jgi:hypothetical protein
MQFVTVTVAGLAPRSYAGVGAPPGPAQIQAAISAIFQSDGYTAQSIVVKASETGLIDLVSSGGNPYTATVTLVVADDANPDDVGAIIGQEIGKALGQPVDTIGTATTSASATAPAAPPASNSWLDNVATQFNTDVEMVIIGLLVLAAIAIVVLSPELKKQIAV